MFVSFTEDPLSNIGTSKCAVHREKDVSCSVNNTLTPRPPRTPQRGVGVLLLYHMFITYRRPPAGGVRAAVTSRNINCSEQGTISSV